MKTLNFTFETQNTYSTPIRGQAVTLRCLPRPGEGQTPLHQTVQLSPAVPLLWQDDGLGNRVAWVTLSAPHTEFRYTSRGSVQVEANAPAPPPHPMYRLPAPRTAVGPGLAAFGHGLGLSPLPDDAPSAAFWAVGDALCDAIHTRLTYAPGSTCVATPAEQALAQGRGVCQDFAQIFVALARQIGLPARYCMGLTVGEGATHAWAELYFHGAWHGWDPTRGQRTDDHYLRFAVGRDSFDCPVERGVFFGSCDQLQTVFMRVWV